MTALEIIEAALRKCEIKNRGYDLTGDEIQDALQALEADLTTDGTGQAVTLATGVALGKGRVRITSKGLTTEDLRIAFGTSSANAIANLNISGGAATTGVWVGSVADGYMPTIILGVPASATHVAVERGTNADVFAVSIEQGN